MSRLSTRLTRLESRKAPGDWVYVVHFNTTGMTRDEVVAEQARMRRAKGNFRPFTLAPFIFSMPEPMEDKEEWLNRFSPKRQRGGTDVIW